MTAIIVCEVSANHGGSFDRAAAIVDAAAKAGATHCKFQTYMPTQLVGQHDYVIPQGPWEGQRLIALYRAAWTPWDWHPQLFDRARKLGMIPFSSPFSLEAVKFLETLDCPMYKIASFEIVDLPLIDAVAKTGKPMVISTGMATHNEIAEAVTTARNAGCRDLTLLKCTSGYPSQATEVNLATMRDMRSRFGCKVGVSDHTLGIGVAVAAATFGAEMIEKHLTLSRKNPSPDAHFSLEPDEFAAMVSAVNDAREAIGTVKYGPTPGEESSLHLRRSLYFALPMKQSDRIAAEHVRTARPALGLAPRELQNLIGRQVRRDIKAGEPVRWESITW